MFVIVARTPSFGMKPFVHTFISSVITNIFCFQMYTIFYQFDIWILYATLTNLSINFLIFLGSLLNKFFNIAIFIKFKLWSLAE